MLPGRPVSSAAGRSLRWEKLLALRPRLAAGVPFGSRVAICRAATVIAAAPAMASDDAPPLRASRVPTLPGSPGEAERRELTASRAAGPSRPAACCCITACQLTRFITGCGGTPGAWPAPASRPGRPPPPPPHPDLLDLEPFRARGHDRPDHPELPLQRVGREAEQGLEQERHRARSVSRSASPSSSRVQRRPRATGCSRARVSS